MRQSTLFAKTQKTSPEGEATANAILLTRGGFIAKSSAGVYSLLPLGLRVLSRINDVIREEMNGIGAEELLMPALVDKKYWQQSGRWETDVVYRATGKKEPHEFEYGLGWTHEEVIASIASQFIQSYRDLPKAAYQIQTKFRAEVRAQGGLLRGREFLMKDLYSFHTDIADLERYYEVAKAAYSRIFSRLGLTAIIAEASGGDFTKDYTHEFQVPHPAGEDTVYYCTKCGFGQNKEVFDVARHTKCTGDIQESRAIEVGNIFKLGTRFSESFGLRYKDTSGSLHPVIMGSYGIGPTRVMGTIVEVMHDDAGIVWPLAIAPFAVHLLSLGKSEEVKKHADACYKELQSAGIQVLYDDREGASAGEKLADADLLGIPYRAVISEKTLPEIELKVRSEKTATRVPFKKLLAVVS